MKWSEKLNSMIATNKEQRQYYEDTNSSEVSDHNSSASNIWRKLRARAMLGVSEEARGLIYQRHESWMGDLSDKKVLELGVAMGCSMTAYLAHHAREYHALDLSASQIDVLRGWLGEAPNRVFHVADFLSDDFSVGEFDVIYAHSVLHHFRYIDIMCDALEARLVPGGQIISYDPMGTWFPLRLARTLYRPFQTDAEWEFPFDRNTLEALESRFDVVDSIGVFGRGKWGLILAMVSPSLGQKYGDRWFEADFKDSGNQANLLSALHASLNLKRRPRP